MNIRLPGMNGIEVTRRLTRDHPGIAVLMVSAYDEDEYVRCVPGPGPGIAEQNRLRQGADPGRADSGGQDERAPVRAHRQALDVLALVLHPTVTQIDRV